MAEQQRAPPTPGPESRAAGSRRNRRPQHPWPERRILRILSLDGGGLKGLYAARLLALTEAQLGIEGRTHRYFDYITGTSTGGIIGLGLANGIPASQIELLYARYGPEIFPERFGRFIPRRALKLVWHPYNHARLEALLAEAFGDDCFGDLRTRVCVPACDGSLGETWVFKTPHHEDYRSDWKRSVAHVARCTSAAPTFLAPLKSQGYTFLDGGLFANDPIMVAVADALACYAVDRARIHVLSIGAGGKRPLIGRLQGRLGGGLFWARKIAETMIDYAGQNAQGQAKMIIGHENIVRLEPGAAAASIEMDDYRRVARLMPWEAQRAFEAYGPLITGRFFAEETEPPRFFHGSRAVEGPTQETEKG